MVSFAVILLGTFSISHALVCYESDEKGVVREVANEQWRYCALIPETDHSEGKLFGIGTEEENLSSYDNTFNQSDALYKVLSVCIYEKYDLSKLSPRFGPAEFLFRCVCNYDRCNSHQTFPGYLHGVHEDNE